MRAFYEWYEKRFSVTSKVSGFFVCFLSSRGEFSVFIFKLSLIWHNLSPNKNKEGISENASLPLIMFC